LPLIANVILGMLAGVAFGAVMGPLAARHNRRARSMLGPLPAEDFAVVLRAAARGPVPADPQLRRAAGRLAQLRLDELNRNRAWTSAVFLLAFLLEVYAAVVTSAWFWLGALVFASAIAGQLWFPRRLLRRIEQLHSGDDLSLGPTDQCHSPRRHVEPRSEGR